MVLVGVAPATQRRGRSACEGKIPRLQKIQTNGIDAGWGGGSPMAGPATECAMCWCQATVDEGAEVTKGKLCS